jgi:hypothetical protein
MATKVAMPTSSMIRVTMIGGVHLHLIAHII